MLKKWELVRQEKGADLSIFKVRFDYYHNLRNNKEIKATVLESNDSVNVVALTDNDEIILIRQFRFGTSAESIEIPGGFVDAGEDHLTAARRELREETGFTGSDWQYLGFVDSNSAFMTSTIHHWLVRDVRQTDSLKLDDGEEVEVVKVPVSKLAGMARNGQITHPHTISGLVRVFNLWV